MREILFRGKRISNSKWVEGFMYSQHFPLEFRDDFYIRCYDTDYLVIPETVGQYTGLTDKNGVRIFEGDIAEYEGKYYVVRYSEKYARFIFTRIGSEYAVFTVFDYERCEVIGNIHDNPNMLKGGG